MKENKIGVGIPKRCSGEEFACQCRKHRRHTFDPCVNKVPGVGNGNPLQYSCPGIPMERGAGWAIVYGVTQSWTLLSGWANMQGRVGSICLCHHLYNKMHYGANFNLDSVISTQWQTNKTTRLKRIIDTFLKSNMETW